MQRDAVRAPVSGERQRTGTAAGAQVQAVLSARGHQQPVQSPVSAARDRVSARERGLESASVKLGAVPLTVKRLGSAGTELKYTRRTQWEKGRGEGRSEGLGK